MLGVRGRRLWCLLCSVMGLRFFRVEDDAVKNY